MPHGYPDWGRDDPEELLYGLPDMAELAVRLGSPTIFDRHGHVLWMDDFESGIDGWARIGAGANNDQVWSPVSLKGGGFSFLHLCGSDGLLQSHMWRHWAYPVASAMGFEFSVYIDRNITAIELNFDLYSGTRRVRTALRYTAATFLWEYRDAAFAWAPLDPVYELHTALELFHTIKLVVDLPGEQYVRVIVDNMRYDLAGVPVNAAVWPLVPYLYADILFTGTALRNAEAFVEDVILTQHEP